MAGRMRDRFANDIAESCEPVMEKALKFWHPTANLRVAQLAERIFVSYNVVVNSELKRNGKRIRFCPFIES